MGANLPLNFHRSETVCDRTSSVIVGSGTHDDFPGHGTKTAFGLPMRRALALRWCSSITSWWRTSRRSPPPQRTSPPRQTPLCNGLAPWWPILGRSARWRSSGYTGFAALSLTINQLNGSSMLTDRLEQVTGLACCTRGFRAALSVQLVPKPR